MEILMGPGWGWDRDKLTARTTDRPFDFKPPGLAIASWFREVSAHMALNGLLHWGERYKRS